MGLNLNKEILLYIYRGIFVKVVNNSQFNFMQLGKLQNQENGGMPWSTIIDGYCEHVNGCSIVL